MLAFLQQSYKAEGQSAPSFNIAPAYTGCVGGCARTWVCRDVGVQVESSDDRDILANQVPNGEDKISFQVIYIFSNRSPVKQQ